MGKNGQALRSQHVLYPAQSSEKQDLSIQGALEGKIEEALLFPERPKPSASFNAQIYGRELARNLFVYVYIKLGAWFGK